MTRITSIKFIALLAGTLLTGFASAQSEKPVSLIVGYAAGGSADFVARVIAEAMSRRLGRQIIIENVPGASGMLATQRVLNAPADGSMIYMAGTDTVLVPMVNAKVKLDWEKDFVPLGRVTSIPMVFAVSATSPHSTLADLLGSLRKSGKEGFNYAIPGLGTMQHLYGALISKQVRDSMTPVPYRGGAPIVNDLIGGQVDSAVLVLSTAMPFLKNGKIKALSISDTPLVAQLSSVKPLADEEGFHGLSLPLWQGLFVKTGTPPAVVAAFEKAMLEAASQPEVRAKLAESGVSAAPLKGSETREFVARQAAVYREIVKGSKITME